MRQTEATQKGGGKGRIGGTCFRCGKLGHRAAECRSVAPGARNVNALEGNEWQEGTAYAEGMDMLDEMPMVPSAQPGASRWSWRRRWVLSQDCKT